MPWLCAQIGAREHYAIPRALSRAGRLTALYTDFWAGPMVRNLPGLTALGKFRPLAGRFHPELPDALVRSWNWRALDRAVKEKLKFGERKAEIGSGGLYAGFVEVGKRFACALREELKRRPKTDGDSILFAYDTGALEAFEWAHERGIRCVLNQMDPNRIEVELVGAEEMRWPGWTLTPHSVPEEYFQRREREWALADCVVVNSKFCKEALLKQAVPQEKLFVLPLCYEVEESGTKVHNNEQKSNLTTRYEYSASSPLRVLFLGQVVLRKGIQYLIQAARLLESESIQFDVVGPVGISAEAVESAPKNMRFHGRVNRAEAADWYRRADIFVLPTLSDGFAITQLEAMAHGLPVITTPCCGEVVRDGVEGFVVPPRDAHSLAAMLQRCLGEPELLKFHRAAAREKSRQFTLKRLTENLLMLEQTLIRGCSPAFSASPFTASHV